MEFGFMFRARRPEECMVGTTAAFLFQRFHLRNGERLDFTANTNWYRAKLTYPVYNESETDVQWTSRYLAMTGMSPWLKGRGADIYTQLSRPAG